ncbi:MAG: phosphate ABC transporter permease subunit PstC [Thermoprotei archaeon]|nr:MAG: phosphate ABC transporter permease subunit PstC [Thermoprotei archaeon]
MNMIKIFPHLLNIFNFMKKRRHPVEIILPIIALSSVLILILIIVFVLNEALPALLLLGPGLILNEKWRPYYEEYGALPLILGSLLIVSGSVLIAVPLGVLSAIFLTEYLPRSLREPFRSVIELLAAIPSIIYGFLGMMFIAPAISDLFEVPLGKTALAGSIVLSMMIVPTIVSISSEVIASVPKEYKMAALALGATKWQCIRSVVLPTAMPGIFASILLALGRAIGETVAVLMVCGCVPTIPSPLWNYLSPVHTLTSAIALDMGEVAIGSLHYHVLFGLGVILMVITFTVNTIADLLLKRAPRSVIRI